MKHLWANAVDAVSWVFVALILGFLGCRSYVQSDDRPAIVKRWIFSIILVLIILLVLSRGSPLLDVIVILVPAVILGFLWMPSIVSTLIRPLTGAFDGGNEETERKPFYFTAEGKRRKGLYHEAIEDVRKQLQLFPGDYEGYMKLASIQMENLNDLSAAQATLNEFVETPGRAPNEIVGALHLLADWQLQFARDARGAGATLQRIIEIFPNTPFAHAAQQRIAHLDSADETARVRHESRFTVPSGERDAGLRAKTVAAASAADPQARVEQYVRQLQLHPSDTEAREQLAVLYAEEFQRVDLASDQLEQLIALAEEPPKHVARWLNLLATIQIKCAGDLDAANRALRRITERFPGGALSAVANRRLASLEAELKACQQTAPKALGSYEKDLGLKHSTG